MRFAIRDDDTCYFTRPEELEKTYSRLPGFPVALAVTPFALHSENLGDPIRFRQHGPPAPLGKNSELIAYLREQVASRRYSILCHGFTHEYQRQGQSLIQECLWKDPARLAKETRQGKRYLEDVLDCPVDTYVPPGNSISRAGIEAVSETFHNILATLPLRRAVEFVFDGAGRQAWSARLVHQFQFGGPSPFVYSLGRARLLACTSWTSVADWQLTNARLDQARRLGADFTLAVHYWELKGKVLDGLLRLADRAVELGFEPVPCSQLFTGAAQGPRLARAPKSEEPRKEALWVDSKTL